ncbi:hypothetical protein CERSUDRAFT_127409 [Gelatoporia subvermispora B]|uniref:F-box domain-containing protein n=1 Tax=Ceriporiopsis subvermispora (strain B) TaxID=914234 RepID=M2P7T3_CERS8|nr:hypothetical protein CERSUDRAFT_127409 [Gelatoporia subvermispora B]
MPLHYAEAVSLIYIWFLHSVLHLIGCEGHSEASAKQWSHYHSTSGFTSPSLAHDRATFDSSGCGMQCLHPVFHNYDVLREIFELSLDLPYGRRTVAHTARSCKAFLHVALDVLWSDLDDIIPLTALLDANIVDDSVAGVETQAVAPRATISDGDWYIFQCYARRVRKLSIQNDSMSTSVLSAMLRRARGQPVLPGLVGLKWATESSCNTAFVRLLPPTLCWLHVDARFRHGGSPPLDLLSAIYAQIPHVRTLTLSVNGPISLSGISLFRDLKSLTVMQPDCFDTTIDLGAVQAAAHLEDLQDFRIDLPRICPDTIQWSDTSFQTLKKLKVVTLEQHWCNMITLLSAITSPHLTSVNIAFGRTQESPHCPLCGIYVSLDVVKKRWTDCLQEVRIMFFYLPRRGSVTGKHYVLSLRDLLEPLYALRKLRILEISLQHVMKAATPELEEADVWRMGNAWPNLESVKIEAAGVGEDEFAAPPIQSWVCLALQCPRLHTLDVPAARLASLPEQVIQHTRLATQNDCPQSGLRHLLIHRLMPQHSAEPAFTEAASLLCDTFPDLVFNGKIDWRIQCPEWSRLHSAMEKQRRYARDVRDKCDG